MSLKILYVNRFSAVEAHHTLRTSNDIPVVLLGDLREWLAGQLCHNVDHRDMQQDMLEELNDAIKEASHGAAE